MSKILLNTAYFPPVPYFSCMKANEEVLVEQWENYGKQSYRNRCEILSANGVLTLSVPVKKADTPKFLVRDACIDYSIRWQKLHFKGVESAYKNSPYYDYYIDDLIVFFEKKEKYLLDLNTRILEKIRDILGLSCEILLTGNYRASVEDIADMRDVLHPKPSRRTGENPDFKVKEYTQTFADRFPFKPGLSILDLLFNTGPGIQEWL